ncbi:MAG: hypothetical protein GWN76_13080, partial [candidate division Zixibacteria bacterium]|nr:hypothetical protein [Phycisphaerae bacterium]NIR64967.1 hypothetical protein [candidate division Zixibacteria bacterium]NIU14909.1 hypothetical protein [candidate division Zixibacteria bacterium]NIW98794.1 hypothetical protein [Phycisphaerae bacterium]
MWTVIGRTVNSSSVKYVEQFQPFDWEKVSSPYDQNDCYYVDSGTGAWNTLTHLEGATVAGYADGRPIGTYTVSSGAISPTGTYTNKLAGLPFTSVYETMPLYAIGKDGPVLGEWTDIMDLRVKFYKSLGCHVGPDSSNLVDWEFSPDSFATTLDVVTDFKVAPFVWGLDDA